MDKFLQLMNKLNISQVYWVDDENASAAELDVQKLVNAFVSGLLNAPYDEARGAIGPFRSVSAVRSTVDKIQAIIEKADEDEDSKAERIVPLLKSIIEQVENAPNILTEGLRKLPVPLRGTEKEALVSLFGKNDAAKWKWQPLSFSRWEKEKQSMLESKESKEPVLFVIDLQNNSESTATDGYTVLSDLVAANLDRKSCHLVVLTSECKKDHEFRKGRSLTEKYCVRDAKRIPVFVLSKHRFASSPQGVELNMASAFVNALERADLSLVQLEFAGIMRQHFIKSIDVALNALESVTIEELMFAVTYTSKSEGVSEVETLLRLMSIAQREEFQRVIVDNVELQSAVIRLRNARIPIDRTDLGTDTEILKLRCAELYDKPEVINKLYSPVAPGDLFALRKKERGHEDAGAVTGIRLGEEQLYVVAANACDLMLRENGTRKLDQCILLPLGNQGHVPEKQFGFSLSHLEFTKVLNASKKQIELRHYVSAPLMLLDLCWTNVDGICAWSERKAEIAQNNLLDSQRARLKTLNEVFRSIDVGVLDSIARPLGVSWHVVNPEGIVDEVKFEVRRAGRLSHSHAAQLVTRFASVFARPSEEHDFSASQ